MNQPDMKEWFDICHDNLKQPGMKEWNDYCHDNLKQPGIKEVNVAIVLDVTDSMQEWIDICRDTLAGIIASLKIKHQDTLFKLSFVGYRDFNDTVPFIILDFTHDISLIKQTIQSIDADGGDDIAEDVAGALEKVLKLSWSENSTNIVLWIADAPAHGTNYHSILISDRYPKGDPRGRDPKTQITELFSRGIDFTFFRITSDTDIMVNTFYEASNAYDINFTVLDIKKQKSGCFERDVENKYVFSQAIENTISDSIGY